MNIFVGDQKGGVLIFVLNIITILSQYLKIIYNINIIQIIIHKNGHSLIGKWNDIFKIIGYTKKYKILK